MFNITVFHNSYEGIQLSITYVDPIISSLNMDQDGQSWKLSFPSTYILHDFTIKVKQALSSCESF